MSRGRPRLGLTLLAVYLMLHGLVQLVHLHFTGLSALLGLLAIVTGALILLGR